jgi:hypothetical protein
VSRAECLKTNSDVGGGIDDWHHYPNETCDSVKKRCGPNPC